MINDFKFKKNISSFYVLLYLYFVFFLYFNLNSYESNFIVNNHGYGRINPLFVNYSTYSHHFQNGTVKVYRRFCQTLKRKFNNFISWSDNVLQNVTQGHNLSAEILNKRAITVCSFCFSVKNVIVNQGTTFSQNGNFMYVRQYFSKLWYIFKNGTMLYTVDEALITGHNHCRNNFGHIIHDFFLPLMIFPEKILKNVYIISMCNPNIANEFFEAVGVDLNYVIYLPPECWVSCKTLYTIDRPSPLLNYFGITSKTFHEKCRDHWGLDKINATKFMLSNRRSGMRSISNFNELVEQCKIQLPDYDWEVLIDYFPSIKDTALVWASIKFAFMPSGSNCAKVYFMHSYTCLCVGEANHVDYSPMMDAAAVGVFSRWFYFDGMDHYEITSRGTIVDIDYSIENIKYGLYAIKHHKWPSSILDISIAIEILKKKRHWRS